jgi:hypothetical protein
VDGSGVWLEVSSYGDRVAWSGRIVAVQPRIHLTRSWSELAHGYQGYLLRVDGSCAGDEGEILIGVGKAAHEKHRFAVGMELNGLAVPVVDPRREVAQFYRTSRIRIEKNADETPCTCPPFLGVPPQLETYRERGHRRLDPRTYAAKCTACIWGCRMPVMIIVDPWNPSQRYRFETFCYGPRSCPLYRAGATRKVPGRKGMTYEEEDWVDQEAVSHRGLDD